MPLGAFSNGNDLANIYKIFHFFVEICKKSMSVTNSCCIKRTQRAASLLLPKKYKRGTPCNCEQVQMQGVL